jgi:hypothetical protein
MSMALRNSRYVGDVVFRRTVEGDKALNNDAALNRTELRRLLAALDGRRTADALAPAFRAHEMMALLNSLQARGLIESVGGAFSLQAINRDGLINVRSPLALHELEAAKVAAMGAARELLGSTARSSLREIEQCRDSAMLRSAIDTICDRLARVLGADAVAIFVESTRRAVRS